ncbi:bacillithiol biosynthesis cysteine-adding enzyme BshC [Saccharococcus thermophilus]|uniref:Putative cysteine ligase BshC n=1 Tax=Saccharococcus thermophilus TaxID=29396 RepID=A0A846MDE9_9BACL|nr:bacillithiol biosynthesis cysteine-adding enzyme BshC [Saccharococcus thermophilus]NIK14140.1 bacillithiol biosynthesis cysteine-adding enzyme BshC [Saccharococcus thermophilus]
MEVREVPLAATTPLATDYINGTFPTEKGFSYSLEAENVFRRRLSDIKERTYSRRELVSYLRSYHKQFSASVKTMENIEKLLDPESVVVVGGQQAGLLTGPLYTIYKIITIIQLAKEQERQLGVPVVPLFWIAGEDHDIAEVNHVYVSEGGKMKKYVYPHLPQEKRMVADVPLDRQSGYEWIANVVKTYGETETTNKLLDFLFQCLDESQTFVDFFASIVLRLFASEGLVVLNAADAGLRALEGDFFAALIERHRDVTAAVLQKQAELRELGYQQMLDIHPHSANLFYYDGRERWLLEYDPQKEMFCSKKGEVLFAKEELMQLAKTKPAHLSNNVVTRPLMQEFLLPTLAFVAGPGEIAYWAELKGTFSIFGLQMPPVVPRLHMTIVERSIQTDLADIGIDIMDVLNGRIETVKQQWLAEKTRYPLEDIFAKAKEEIEEIHRPLREIGMEIDRGLAGVLAKNATLVQAQIDFLQQTLQRALMRKYEVQLQKFLRVEMALRPNKAPQERIWNIFYYINKYGFGFVEKLFQWNDHWNGMHKIVYI